MRISTAETIYFFMRAIHYSHEFHLEAVTLEADRRSRPTELAEGKFPVESLIPHWLPHRSELLSRTLHTVNLIEVRMTEFPLTRRNRRVFISEELFNEDSSHRTNTLST